MKERKEPENRNNCCVVSVNGLDSAHWCISPAANIYGGSIAIYFGKEGSLLPAFHSASGSMAV